MRVPGCFSSVLLQERLCSAPVLRRTARLSPAVLIPHMWPGADLEVTYRSSWASVLVKGMSGHTWHEDKGWQRWELSLLVKERIKHHNSSLRMLPSGHCALKRGPELTCSGCREPEQHPQLGTFSNTHLGRCCRDLVTAPAGAPMVTFPSFPVVFSIGHTGHTGHTGLCEHILATGVNNAPFLVIKYSVTLSSLFCNF